MSDQNVSGAWLANGDIVLAEVGERTDTGSPRPVPVSVLKVVGPAGERPLSRLEGVFVNTLRSLGTHDGRERVEVGGGFVIKEGYRVYGKRVIEFGVGGGARTIWDSLQLPIEPGLEPQIRFSDDGESWVAAVCEVKYSHIIGARVLVGSIETTKPQWTATVRPDDVTETAAQVADAFDVALLGRDLAAVLMKGTVFLVGPPGVKIVRPVLRPSLGRGRMLFADARTRLLTVYEFGTNALSCFLVDDEAAAPAGVAAPDFMIDEKTVGFPSIGVVGATREGLIVAALAPGSSTTHLVTVSMSRHEGVRVVDRRVLPTAGKIDDIRLTADGGTIEWTEPGQNHSQTLFRSTIVSLSK